MSYLTRLQLHHFRNYTRLDLDDLGPGFMILTGPNGAGKTNLLEAVSLLSPGRGLRGAGVEDLQSQDTQDQARDPWSVSANIHSAYGSARLGTGRDPGGSSRRLVRINGENVRSQAELGTYLACVWLTPQMDRLFTDSAGARRRFLDRLVYAFDPGHSGRTTRYDNALSQRAKLLREGVKEPAWLASLEAQMAETGVAIAAARLDFISRLQAACDAADHETQSFFPRGLVDMSGFVEDRLKQGRPALEVEEAFAHALTGSRERDAHAGGAGYGPHRSDMLVTYADKNMPAAQCSTGEQKALLVGVMLAHAAMVAGERGAPPLILLDEIAAHLDERRRAALFERLQTGGQVWMTGTEKTLFSPHPPQSQIFRIENGGRVRLTGI